MRAFPISNWTELDVWRYIQREQIALPSLYFAHKRNVFERDGLIWPVSDFVYADEKDVFSEKMVRFRTVGDMTCTAAVESDAVELEQVIREIQAATISERGARIDDKRSESAMEERKKTGYF